MSDLWVFGYGSLMWQPGFEFEEAIPATLVGFHRSLCIYSWIHRGTQEKPGLVFGLDEGGHCAGMAFRVRSELVDKTTTYLRAREQQTMVYKEILAPVEISQNGPRRVEALSFVADQDHEQYAQKLSLEEQLEIVQAAKGQSGENDVYVINTYNHMEELGIIDKDLAWIVNNLRR
ncbi:gamma-glutamylcyclotransferase [Polycladidibacter stylochi]|uniref:gamma-glutamylcyclotransferase n=1 Tax=Polycladidibacter stylochi TaxID=1807766 RepID=UPI0008357BFB|nr:gamma-glutamylcyclotransferase [Pseudovibrio stylochi]